MKKQKYASGKTAGEAADALNDQTRLTITIEGPCGSGKTVLAGVIADALKIKGYSVQNFDNSSEWRQRVGRQTDEAVRFDARGVHVVEGMDRRTAEAYAALAEKETNPASKYTALLDAQQAFIDSLLKILDIVQPERRKP